MCNKFRSKKERKNIRSIKIKRTIADCLFLLLACSMGAFATVAVLLPNGLTSGGLTGIVRLIQSLTGFNFSLIYYAFSLIIALCIWLFLGFKEVKKTLLLAVMYPAVLWIFEKFQVRLLEEKDVLLAAVFYGVFSGICTGIATSRGYCFSGTDGISKIIRRKLFPQVAQGKIMTAIDGAITVSSAFIFNRNIALYALITQAIISKTIDVITFGFEYQVVQVEIITKDKAKDLLEYILIKMRRGASTEKIVGQYTKTQHTKIRVFCSPRESMLLKRKIAEIDSSAFVSVIKTEAVWANGKGFKNIEEEN